MGLSGKKVSGIDRETQRITCVACGSGAQVLSAYQDVEEGPDHRFALEGVELVAGLDWDYHVDHIS